MSTHCRQRVVLPITDFDGTGNAALNVERSLLRVLGVMRVYINPETEMAYVEYDCMHADVGCLITAIEDAGFHAGKPVPR